MDKVKTIIITVLATIVVAFIGLYILGSMSDEKTPATSTPTSVSPTAPATPSQPAATQPTASETTVSLPQVFDDAKAGYVMNYPTDWTYEKPEEGSTTVLFSGKDGTPAARATINIQNLLTTKSGGSYKDATAASEDLKTQLQSVGKDVKFLGEKPLVYTTQGGETINGIQWLVEYTYKNEAFRQWQIVLPRPGGNYLHAIAYTAPAAIYDTFEPVASAMIQSWKIKE